MTQDIRLKSLVEPREDDSRIARGETLGRQARKGAYVLGGIVVVLVLWAAAISIFAIPGYLLPEPWSVAASFADNFGLIAREGAVTAEESVLGFFLALGCGIVAAVVMYIIPAIRAMFMPLLIGAQAIPKIALAPLFVVWIGFGLGSKVLNAFLIGVFPVVLNTFSGLASQPTEITLLSRVLSPSNLRGFWKIRLPHAAPNIFAGLKIAMTLCVIGAVVGEFVASNSGLGEVLLNASSGYRVPLSFAAILGLSLVGVILYSAVVIAEYILLPGFRRSRDAGK